jgi:diacylglycerol kinase family enzyme
MPCPISVFVNAGSGAAQKIDADTLERAFLHRGVHPRIEVLRGEELARAADDAARGGHLVVAAGGDGTVSTVAAAAVRHRATLGVIPLGTLNHFARDLGLPLDMDGAVAAIAAGRTRLVDIGDLNGRTFLNNASVGLYPRVVREREMERQRGRHKWTAFAIAVLRTWVRHRTVTVRLTVDGRSLVRRTPFVFVGNGEYKAEGLGLGTRASLGGGRLSIYVAPECDRMQLLLMSLRAIAGRLSAETRFEAHSASEVTIEVFRRYVTVALDGELVREAPPLRCAIRASALEMIVGEAV